MSDNFNHSDFTCRCPSCKGSGEYKIHLGLVGALEMIATHFRKKPKIFSAFRCEESAEKISGTKRSLHSMGKAVHAAIEGVSLADLYKFAFGIEELKGIGIYPKDNFIHLDTRSGDRAEWVKEGDSYNPLTTEKKKQYGLI